MVWQLRNWYCANMAVRGIESAFIHDNRPSENIAPKGGNTAPKKPNGKAGLPNGVSGNPISSNGSTRTGGRVSDRAGIKKRPNRRQRSEKRIIGLGRTRYPPYHHLQIEEPQSRRHCPDSR